MGLLALFGHVPLAVAVAWAASTGIPFISALLTKRPSAYTGAITVALSAAAGFLSQYAVQLGHPGYNWKAALGATLVSFMVARGVHAAILPGTRLQTALHRAGPQIGA